VGVRIGGDTKAAGAQSTSTDDSASKKKADSPLKVPWGWTARGVRAYRPAPAPAAQSVEAQSDAPRGPSFGAAYEADLDRLTGTKVVPGNRVTPLFDGVESFEARDTLIKNAKSSICLQTFIFNSDDTGQALAKALADKAKEGVKVRVLYDALGSSRADPKMFQMMADAGVELRGYNPPSYLPLEMNHRWHEKHLVVDGASSIEGGMNIADEYAYGGSGRMVLSRGDKATEAWKDTDVLVQGPVVHDTQAAFVRNWDKVGPPLIGPEREALFPELKPVLGGIDVRVVQHRPREDNDRNTHELYRRTIDEAQTSLLIENAYFLPHAELREALARAASRGVDVEVITNSKASSDMGVVTDAAHYFYEPLLKAGVKIHERLGSGTLHAKTLAADGKCSLVGSANLNGRSEGHDSEVVLSICNDPDTAQRLAARFKNDLKSSEQVTPEKLKAEPFMQHLREWIFSGFAETF
jgi:cardiolipin synthase